MTLVLTTLCTIIILLIILWFTLEIVSGQPLFFFKTILLRDFKILLFNGLYENGMNKQCYVIAGVTWFGIPITYQAYEEDIHTMDYAHSFVVGKKHWIREGCKGFSDYKEAKSELILVKKVFIKKKKQVIWISNTVNENKL